jgi:hypothetical protein
MIRVKIVLPKGLQAQIDENEIDFRDRLYRAASSPVLVFDSATQSGWLIPEISLILHMTHEYLKQTWVQTPMGVDLPYAEASLDGGMASFLAVTEHGNVELWSRQEDGKAKRFMDVVDDYIKLFGIIRKEVNMKKAIAGKKLLTPWLLGWDFVDIMAKEHLLYERELPKEMGPRMQWWELATATDILVIFGSNFGQMIRPDPAEGPICKAWGPIPGNVGLLTASVLPENKMQETLLIVGSCQD